MDHSRTRQRRIGSVGWLMLILLASMIACAPAPPSRESVPPSRRPGAAPPIESVPAPIADVERQAFSGVNDYRTSIGLRPLVNDAYLAQIARHHSRAMAQGLVPFGHAQMKQRAGEVRAYMPARGFAENVAKSSRSLDRVAMATVRNWIASPVHLHNIEGRYSTSGIGAARNEQGVTYLTQVFAGQGG